MNQNPGLVHPQGSLNTAPPFPEASSPSSTLDTAYKAAKAAVENIDPDSGMTAEPLNAVVDVLWVIIKKYGQTTTKHEMMNLKRQAAEPHNRDIPTLSDSYYPPHTRWESREEREEEREEWIRKQKERREAFVRKLTRFTAKLGPLPEKLEIAKFLKNFGHSNILNGFVRELTDIVTSWRSLCDLFSARRTVRCSASGWMIHGSFEESMEETDEDIIAATDLELLRKLGSVYNAGYQVGSHSTCLRGTRESVLDEIIRWAEDPQGRPVFWLSGLAGTGKSTIARTFCEMAARAETLGASFFCSRDYLGRKELKNVFPTLSYQLACRYPTFQSHLTETIKRDPPVAQNSLIFQFKKLIFDPLLSTEISCIIVVDALDECVDDQSTSAIFSVLGRYVQYLPSVKFFITGRPEPRIPYGFRLPLPEVFTDIFFSREIDTSGAHEDIRLYLQEKLTAVVKHERDLNTPDPLFCDEDLAALTNVSSGFFIVASTLARFIESSRPAMKESLRFIITSSENAIREGQPYIDPLYTRVLIHASSDVESPVTANLRKVLGAVILAFNPLSREQIAKILHISSLDIANTLQHLRSVLFIPNESFKEIRVFHKSFPDFLQNPDRCSDPRFFIDSPVHHGDMALGCLELLKKLEPNLCDLPQFVMNRDVPDLSGLLEDKVGGAIRYACSYWAMHIRSSPTTDDHAIQLITSATDFFESKVIPWIEVMSLENQLERIIHSMYDLFDWLGRVNVPDPGLRSLAEDCLRFTMHFFYPIQQSALHIYHSALPLSPRSSIFHSMSPEGETQIAGFYGHPDAWGAVIRTIKGGTGRLKCMTTFGNMIATANDKGTVGIYDSTTGVLRLALNLKGPALTIRGSPDNSTIFITHAEPATTLWDIQTGGLIHAFHAEGTIEDIAVSLNGRYFARGLSNGSVKIFGVASRTPGATIRRGSPITNLCWLEPEEQLVVAGVVSVDIWDVVTGAALRSFPMLDPVCGVVYARGLSSFAVTTASRAGSAIIIINPRTGVYSVLYGVQRKLTSFAFSETTKDLVCGMETPGLALFGVSTRRWRRSDHPDTLIHLSVLPNGTVVTSVADSGVQLLNLEEEYATPRQLVVPTLPVPLFDSARIIATKSLVRNSIILLEVATMSPLSTIPRKTNAIPTDRTPILCASLENRQAIYCFEERGRACLQLWRFGNILPKWTAEMDRLPSIGAISPSGALLATLDNLDQQTRVCVRNAQNGRLHAQLIIHQFHSIFLGLNQVLGSGAIHPLEIEFESEDRFYTHHETYRTPFDLDLRKGASRPILRRSQVPLVERPQETQYHVDVNREWVVRGSERVCWIPPGYISSGQGSYRWVGSELVMVGHDGTLRKLTFRS